MTREGLKEIEYELYMKMEKNRKRIDEMHSHAVVRGMRDCPESKWHDAYELLCWNTPKRKV